MSNFKSNNVSDIRNKLSGIMDNTDSDVISNKISNIIKNKEVKLPRKTYEINTDILPTANRKVTTEMQRRIVERPVTKSSSGITALPTGAKEYKEPKTAGGKALSTLSGIGGNLLVGAEKVIPDVIKYAGGIQDFAFNNLPANNAVKTIGGLMNYFSPVQQYNRELNSQEREQWRANTIQQNIDKSYGTAGKYIAELAPSMGSNALNAGITALNPVLGTAMFMGSAGGNYLDEAKQRGMTDNQAFIYASIMGALEGGTEKVISGDAMNWLAKKAGVKKLTQEALEELTKKYGFTILENAVQEGLTEPINEGVAQIVAGKGNTENLWQRSLQSALGGAVSGGLMGAGSMAVGKTAGAINNKIEEARAYNDQNRLTTKLKQQAIEMIQNSKIPDEIKKESIAMYQNAETLTQQDIDAVANGISEVERVLQERQAEQNRINADKKKRQDYMKYKNDTQEYDSSVVNEVNNVYSTNRNGKRTVKQWLTMAEDIGSRISNKTDAEIERIAYKSWFDLEPSKSITKYDNVNKTNVGFQKLSADEWTKAIIDSANKNRQTQEVLSVTNESNTVVNPTDGQVEKIKNISNEKVKKLLEKNGDFSQQIDKYMEGNLPSGDLLYLGETSEILQKIGLSNEPIILKQNKLKKLLKQGTYDDRLHGLSADIVKKIPDALKEPLNILKSSTNDNSIVIITDLADASERPIIASIEVGYNGQIGNIDFLSNRLTSAYGKNNYDRFMQTEIGKGNLLYDIDEGIIKELPATGLQSSKGISSSVDTNNNVSTSTNIISQNNQNMQENSEKVLDNELKTGKYTEQQETKKQRKTMNPSEISNMNKEDASTTPKLPNKKYEDGTKQSSFFQNVLEDSKFLNKDLRQSMAEEENIRYYKGITNEETLQKSLDNLQQNGKKAVLDWYGKDTNNTTAEDVTTGWILLQQYQDAGDYEGAINVAKKMREMGTKVGQAVQAYNIMSRLTPEGMFYYAQSELTEAYNKLVEGKTQKWIDKNAKNFELTAEDTQFIKDTMKDVAGMEDGYDKKVKLAQIQKLLTDKLPTDIGKEMKAWMRISMLFNPKTLVRNVMGNAVVLPVNTVGDIIASKVDKAISKKTGVRTTGTTNISNYAKGFKKGLYESYNDFKLGINTRNIEGNRFEISEGNSFNNNTKIGKALNATDKMLSFMLDAGDRGFYEATFTNSINNQLVLNNATEVTQDMIDIATQEALQRTWQDDNNYTKAVLDIRRILNNVNVKGYGLGDVIIPFAKTPANLTKAIVDYSPVGLVNSLRQGIALKNSLETGQYTAMKQHEFVQNLGKATAGTFLYVLGYVLAKAGIASGEPDDDKDVKNFMKNSLGISSYSIKIGNITFTYDWAQPVATPLAIMTNYVKYSEDNPDANAIEKGIKAMNIGTEQLLEQSFMESLNTVLNGNGTTLENLSKAVLDLPARAVPTMFKQVADMVDGTQRTSFEYDKPVESAINSVKSKIPFASMTLAPSYDTLGNEIKKYGGENNLFNVFLNPANVNKGELSKSGEEIYKVYQQTGDKTIFPRVAPYYINSAGEKITMDSKTRSKFQKVSGDYVEKSLDSLLTQNSYKNLNYDEKAKMINEIVSDSYNKAKKDVLGIANKTYDKLENTLKTVKEKTYYDYKVKTTGMTKDSEKINVLINSNYSAKETQAIYENYILDASDKKYDVIKTMGLNINEYLKYKVADTTSKDKAFNTIEGLKGTYIQKLALFALSYKVSEQEKKTLFNYVNSLQLTKTQKEELFNKFK